MPKALMFLVREISTGKMRTVVGYSERGALREFAAKTKLTGRFAVKLRGSSNPWNEYDIG